MKCAKMGIRRCKKTRQDRFTTIQNIPNELLTEVLARVASDSCTDFFNAKLSCKFFQEIAEDKHVYHHMSLDKIPIVEWKPLDECQRAFLAKCEESNNPEFLYRQAVVDYFSKGQLKSAIRHLDKALNFGHTGAEYLACILVLLSGDGESKAEVVKLLANMRRCMTANTLKAQRAKLIEMLRWIWVDDAIVAEHRPVCCTTSDDHKTRRSRTDDDEVTGCEACRADNELRLISNVLPQIM